MSERNRLIEKCLKLESEKKELLELLEMILETQTRDGWLYKMITPTLNKIKTGEPK